MEAPTNDDAFHQLYRDASVAAVDDVLSSLSMGWARAYRAAAGRPTDMYEVDLRGATFLYDMAGGPDGPGTDRVIGAWGPVPPPGQFSDLVRQAVSLADERLARPLLDRAKVLWMMWADVAARQTVNEVKSVVRPLAVLVDMDFDREGVSRVVCKILDGKDLALQAALVEQIGSLVSRPMHRLRAESRQRRLRVPGLDVGHLLSHSGGGPTDVNLVRQDRALNRGWSEEGRAYRAIERVTARLVGAQRFAHATYRGEEIAPAWISLGAIVPDDARSWVPDHPAVRVLPITGSDRLLVYGIFDNRRAADRVEALSAEFRTRTAPK